METQHEADRAVERLVREIGQVIDESQPEKREELRQMASDLMRQEVEPGGLKADEQATTSQGPLNPIALGALLIVLGAVLFLLLPPIGLILIGAGIAAAAFGFLYRVVIK